MNVNKTIALLLAGDKNAYRNIVEEYTPKVRTYLWGKLANKEIVDDLSQEVFLAVYENLPNFDCTRSFTPWFTTIMKRTLLSHFRRHYSNKNSINVLKQKIDKDLLAMPEYDYTSEIDAINQLKACLKDQPEDVSDILQARYFHKEAVNSIANRLNSSAHAISCLLYRARRILKYCMKYGERW
ncbi:MAG: sigma-70 family RNA polymerase sigma factor [Lentisphaeraceae bacterium]|nr:sigma-70 family RNA polymerase sigma factor [Lentisphaeraceae bacterium]